MRYPFTLFVLAASLATNSRAQVNLPENLGMAVAGWPSGEVQGAHAVFAVDEAKQGVDLDGDGSANDLVLFARDIDTGVSTNTGITIRNPASTSELAYVSGSRLCVGLVPESALGASGTDRNGDGDTNDFVPAAYDFATGTTTNLGLASWSISAGATADFMGLASGRVLFPVSEPDQGNVDLNGDGDTADLVLFAWLAGGGPPVNVGLSWSSGVVTRGPAVGSRHALFMVSEIGSGADMNGDGDMGDNVVHAYDFVTNAATNLGYAGFDVRGDGELFAFTVRESAQGSDLDGDGDLLDTALFAYVGPTGTTVNLGKPVFNTLRPAYNVRGYVIAWGSMESELGGGVDSNGDGDALDCGLFTWHARTGQIRSAGVALYTFGSSDAVALSVADDHVLFIVRESGQGNQDLNGDGDTFDRVAHAFDVRTAVTRNLGIATFADSKWIQAQRDFAFFPYSELEQGAADLNGDGAHGYLLAVHAFHSGTTAVLPRALTNNLDFMSAGTRVVFRAVERPGFPPNQPPGTDFNNDGDTLDEVLFTHDARSGVTINLALASANAAGPRTIGIGPRAAVFSVSEAAQGGIQLNGDLDLQDDVVHIVRFP